MPRKKKTEVVEKKKELFKSKIEDKKDSILDDLVDESNKYKLNTTENFFNNSDEIIRNKGSYSVEILENFESKEQQEAKKIEVQMEVNKILYTAKNTGEILAGKVIGIREDPKRKMVGVRVAYEPIEAPNHIGRVEVVIPDVAFFERKIESSSYNSKSEIGKYFSRKAFLSSYLGAIIHFCIVGIRCETTDDPRFEGEKLTFVVGDRNIAMAKLRDIYFFHKNRKKQTTPPITIKKGDKVEAFVVNVDAQMVTVSALGVETNINLYNLTSDSYTSCNQVVQNGDRLECFVASASVEDNKVNLKLTCRQSVAPSSIAYIRVGSLYLGTVVKYSQRKKLYIVTLANGVSASIPESKVQGYVPLSLGDKVCVQVSAIYETFIAGSAYII